MQRRVRDLSCGDTRIFLELEVRRVDCRRCGRVKRQQLDFLADNPLYTKRFAYFVGRRCRGATIKDVAEELKLDWHTVKTLDQQYMEAQLERAGRPGPQVIGVDEIAIRAQEDFALDAKLKIGNDIWTPETAGARFHAKTLAASVLMGRAAFSYGVCRV
jgi:transposase